MDHPAPPTADHGAVVFRHPIGEAGGVLEITVRLVTDDCRRADHRRAVLDELDQLMREAPFEDAPQAPPPLVW